MRIGAFSFCFTNVLEFIIMLSCKLAMKMISKSQVSQLYFCVKTCVIFGGRITPNKWILSYILAGAINSNSILVVVGSLYFARVTRVVTIFLVYVSPRAIYMLKGR